MKIQTSLREESILVNHNQTVVLTQKDGAFELRTQFLNGKIDRTTYEARLIELADKKQTRAQAKLAQRKQMMSSVEIVIVSPANSEKLESEETREDQEAEQLPEDAAASSSCSSSSLSSLCAEQLENGAEQLENGAEESEEAANHHHEIRTCEVCWEELPVSEMIKLPCDHLFCSGCMQEYVRSFLNQGKVLDLRCPDVSCMKTFDNSVVEAIVPADITDRYVLFRMKAEAANHSSSTVKSCPQCPEGLLLPNDVDAANASVACRICAVNCCSMCSLQLHPNIECAEAIAIDRETKRKATTEYQKSKQRRQNIRVAVKGFVPTICTSVRLLIQPNAKRCPSCAQYIIKNGGCSHMYCSHCRHSFCWNCGGKQYGNHCLIRRIIWPVMLPVTAAFCTTYAALIALPATGAVAIGFMLPIHTVARRTCFEAAKDMATGIYTWGELLAAFPY